MRATPNDPRIAIGIGSDRPHPETIRTDRLVLVPMSVDLMRSILRKDWWTARQLLGTEFPREWREDGWRLLEPQADEGENDERFVVWGTRLAFATAANDGDEGPRAVVAEVGFHGPPDAEGWVEIGFRVVARHQREGLAEEAARALLRWAGVAGASGVKASVSPHNAASIGLLRKLGFVDAGCYEHEALGRQLIFRCGLAP